MAYVIGDDCIACGTCIDECPAGAISEGEKYSINPDACTECGTCADVSILFPFSYRFLAVSVFILLPSFCRFYSY